MVSHIAKLECSLDATEVSMDEERLTETNSQIGACKDRVAYVHVIKATPFKETKSKNELTIVTQKSASVKVLHAKLDRLSV